MIIEKIIFIKQMRIDYISVIKMHFGTNLPAGRFGGRTAHAPAILEDGGAQGEDGRTPAGSTCIVRAWDLKKPLLFCPAMNTAMWDHPITTEQIERLRNFGYIEIACIEKTLMCGDKGLGAMAEVGSILEKVVEVLSKDQPHQ
ncbi:unnamed protein product [Ranitomeya imitator]|uniref:Flavoprotein domain-containing protein n=1 Tax=Ranitomeya imitator TaxID=111125 RepID=A0ABN9MGV9_9NEOB|nr:unnamed protein product [Ranitomeya imitator]